MDEDGYDVGGDGNGYGNISKTFYRIMLQNKIKKIKSTTRRRRRKKIMKKITGDGWVKYAVEEELAERKYTTNWFSRKSL